MIWVYGRLESVPKDLPINCPLNDGNSISSNFIMPKNKNKNPVIPASHLTITNVTNSKVPNTASVSGKVSPNSTTSNISDNAVVVRIS